MEATTQVDDSLAKIKLVGLILAIIGTAFSISLCGIGLGVYMVAAIIQIFSGRYYDWRPYPHAICLVPLLASLMISLFVSEYFMTSLRGLWKYIQGFIFLYAGLDVIRNPKHLKFVIGFFLASFFVAGLAGLSQDVFGVDFINFRESILYRDNILRITGPFKHSNDYATFLIPGFTLTLALIIERIKNPHRLMLLGLILLMCLLSYALIRSMSRGGLISTVSALIFLGMFYRYRWWILSFIMSSLTLLWFIPSHISTRLHGLLEWNSGNIPERLLLLRTTWKMVQESPLFGLGLNTYSLNFTRFRPPNYDAGMYTHNSYLQIAAEAGLVGLMFYVLLLVIFIVWLVRKSLATNTSTYQNLALGVIAGVLGIMVNCLFESCLQSTQLRSLFWILLGIGSALVMNSFFQNKTDNT